MHILLPLWTTSLQRLQRPIRKMFTFRQLYSLLLFCWCSYHKLHVCVCVCLRWVLLKFSFFVHFIFMKTQNIVMRTKSDSFFIVSEYWNVVRVTVPYGISIESCSGSPLKGRIQMPCSLSAVRCCGLPCSWLLCKCIQLTLWTLCF